MNTFRFLLACLVRVVVLLAILVAAAFAPVIQTWIAERKLFHSPDVEGTLGSLTARFGHLEVEDLHLTTPGAVLTLPSLDARLPLIAAWHRNVRVESLVAHGWTLDLSGPPPAKGAAAGGKTAAASAATAETEPPAEADGSPAQRTAAFFRGLLGEWKLPCDLSLSAIDLEGDVLVPAWAGRSPLRVHVVITGGGLAAGREGAFVVDAAVEDSRLPVGAAAAHGQLALAMDTPRTFRRVEFKADVSAHGGSLPATIRLAADAAVSRDAGDETYRLDLSRDGRHLATLVTRYPAATRRLEGTWKVDLGNPDLAPLALDRPLPTFTAAGEGSFDADPAFARVHAVGQLVASASRLEVLAPALERLGPVTLDAHFDVAQADDALRVEQLNLVLAGGGPAATIHALQPFDFDEKTRELKVAEPGADWMAVSFRGLPLAWLSDPTDRCSFSGAATGEFFARADKGGFSVRAKTPLLATGVAVLSGDRTYAQGLDLSAGLAADYNPQGWQVESSALQVSRDGRTLVTVEGKASQAAGDDQPVAVAGTWKADLAAVAAAAGIREDSRLEGRTATGDFSAKIGSDTEYDAKLSIAGRDPNHTLTVSVGAEPDGNGGFSYVAPIRVATGSSVSELSAQGTWSGPGADSHIDCKLTAENVDLDHLRLLAGPLAATGGALAPAGAPRAAAGGADRFPFWGAWIGHLTLEFDHLRTPDRNFDDVGGGFDVEPGSVRLEVGRATLFGHRQVTGEGTLSFDPSAPLPYSLKGTAKVDKIEAVSLFGPTPAGQQPMLEGHFAVTATLTGSGTTLRDLAARSAQEFQFTSKDGILHLLKTSVAESIPEVATPVKDAVGSVGHALGDFLEVKRNANSDKNPVSPSAEAVLNFTTEAAEIGYDKVAVTARRTADGAIQLTAITVDSPDLRLTGSGRIDYVAGRPFFARPLSLDLQVGSLGQMSELLKIGGLLSATKDERGYAVMNQRARFGGTLAAIDATPWHDVLAAAATRVPATKK